MARRSSPYGYRKVGEKAQGRLVISDELVPEFDPEHLSRHQPLQPVVFGSIHLAHLAPPELFINVVSCRFACLS